MKDIRATIRRCSAEEGKALMRLKLVEMEVKRLEALKTAEQLTKIIADYKRMYPYLNEEVSV